MPQMQYLLLTFDERNLVLEFLFCGVAANLAIDLHYLFDNDIKQTGSSSNGLHVLQKCNVIPKQKWIGRNLSIVCSCENAMPRLSSISRRKNGKHLKCSQNLTEKEARFSVGSRSKDLWALAQVDYVGRLHHPALHCVLRNKLSFQAFTCLSNSHRKKDKKFTCEQ